MIIDIWDVGHGACSVLTYPNGTRIMIDAGQRNDPFWAPSNHYYSQHFDLLLLQNLDEDHVENLPRILNTMSFKSLRTNPTVSAEALKLMKRENGMGSGVSAVYDLLTRFSPFHGPLLNLSPNGWATYYWNQFGSNFFTPNNLSLVAFFGYGAFTILFTGDLEESGWTSMLRRPDFCAHLKKVNVLVAPHHGRDNGRSAEIFNWCRPDVVVISDYGIQHKTQETVNWYANRTKGIPDHTKPMPFGVPQKRKVLTTRTDGSLRFSVKAEGTYTVIPEGHWLPEWRDSPKLLAS